ncbi:Uncharacterized protein APZ42_026997 [Daphnia magna]|uniref:Uncharacterized protein n=1 Tax=Daphnia magna TaxID=35525 RepID=A0A164RV49_9CRUS|nr:Uncharacterized protein APZ42_026997 [Daphnia magna]
MSSATGLGKLPLDVYIASGRYRKNPSRAQLATLRIPNIIAFKRVSQVLP